MEEYIMIAEKYLTANSKSLTKGLCFSIRLSELESSNNPEALIRDRINSICYDFSAVRDYTDEYRIRYLLFYNN